MHDHPGTVLDPLCRSTATAPRPLLQRTVAIAAVLATVCLAVPCPLQARETAPDRPLWQLGARDNDNAEFALAPDRYQDYTAPGWCVVGLPGAESQWPYVHPGPRDAWAGTRSQTFTILFSIALPASDVQGTCRLVLDLIDAQDKTPPTLVVELNGNAAPPVQARPGIGDDTVYGEPSAGREQILTVDLPPAALQPGTNMLTITTTSGSWVLYDGLEFHAPPGVGLAPFENGTVFLGATTEPVLRRAPDGSLYQSIELSVGHAGAPCDARIEAQGTPPLEVRIQEGLQSIQVPVPPVRTAGAVSYRLDTPDGHWEGSVPMRPVRAWEICLLHHTHLDIGYTHTQEDVLAVQIQHLRRAVDLAAGTATAAPDERFKWLPEGLWAVEAYLETAAAEDRTAFLDTVKRGQIGLDALYANALTALHSEEELEALLACSRRVAALTGVPITSAMLSDVPGVTWGLVPALSRTGVRHLSLGPNVGHRVGDIYRLGDRPFWWEGPEGTSRVLCWIHAKAYSWFHGGPGTLTAERLLGYLAELERNGYPYDMAALRYNIGGDNGPPDPGLSEFVQDWNRRIARPRLRILTTAELFTEFEARYGENLPVYRGDLTPYWEDGAASSARETGMVRRACEQLCQARAVWDLLETPSVHEQAFYEAWRSALLYDEHTWGAHNSISEPDAPFVREQWEWKRQQAEDASEAAETLLRKALADAAGKHRGEGSLLVVNTLPWERGGVVPLPQDLTPVQAQGLTSQEGLRVPVQTLTDGTRLALIPPVSPGSTLVLAAGTVGPEPSVPSPVQARRDLLDNGLVRVVIDTDTGSVAGLELNRDGAPAYGLLDSMAPYDLAEYVYVSGRDPSQARVSYRDVEVEVTADGPLRATVRASATTPEGSRLTREYTLDHGSARLEIAVTLDRPGVRTPEAVHLAFPFRVESPQIRLDIPYAVIRPDADQLPGACRNYFTIQRWVDVSGSDAGITLVSVDAPLVEVGDLRADPMVCGWDLRTQPGAALYSYAMNNYWETNYRADQPGITRFQYTLHPRTGAFSRQAADRAALADCRPLLLTALP